MVKENQYVPILKAKMGEYSAVTDLHPDVRERITPLFEIPPISWDFINDTPAKTIDQHLRRTPDQLAACWGEGRPVFIDLFQVQNESMEDGAHPLTHLFDELRASGFSAVPVTGLERSGAYQDAVEEAIERDGLGLCLRINTRDLDDEDFQALLSSLLDNFDLDRNQVDLLLDLESIPDEQIGFQTRAVLSYLNDLPGIREWRSLILSATAFPETMADIDKNSIGATTRAEWLIWSMLFGARERIERLPAFSDYTIVHPEPFDMDPRIMQLGAKIKYTSDREWIIVKGESIKRGGSEQTHRLCQRLTGLPEYSGRDFSWADQHIDSCANERTGPGNQMTWVRVGVNHHITYVVRQIASLF
ncbi:MAG: beta family protein [Desulfobacterales bacterium]|nr:beta family protein [Desulfobacterales bacterium]